MQLSELTSSSLVADALRAYAASPFITNKLDRSPRAAEPYFSLLSHPVANLTISQLSRRTVSLYRDQLTADGYAAGTINGIFSKLRKVGGKLVDYELIPSNFFAEVGNAAPTAPVRDTRVLTPEEIDQVVSELMAADPGYARAFLFSCETAARLGEVIALTYDDISPCGTKVYVQKSFDKTRRGRWLHLTDAARALIERQRHDAPCDTRIFPYSRDTLRQALYRISKRLGFPVFWHLSRHTAISKAASCTPSLRELMAFSGHSTIIALQGYVHALGDDVDASLRASLPTTLNPIFP